MPYVSPATVVSGTNISSTTFGNVVKADLDFLARPPACRVTKAALQSIPNNTVTAITFDTERFDTDTMHDTVTNNSRITFTTAGIYMVGGTLRYQSNATGYRNIVIRLNNGNNIAEDLKPIVAAIVTISSIATLYQFIAGDYVELCAEQTSGGALNVEKVNPDSPEFWATWVGTG